MLRKSGHINEPLRIGPVVAGNRLLQAPMSGISGPAFRRQARRFGVGLACTELISSYGLHYRNQRTLEMLRFQEDEHPLSLQLFGNDPGVMAEAAVAGEAAGADIIDINMGCPVRKVIKTGAGVALMADEELAERIVSAMVAVVKVPVSVKMRSGYGKRVSAPSLARRLEAAGAAAVTIHPRLGAQGYKGRADHRVTEELAGLLQIPVIASGDIESPADTERLLGAIGCSGVMVGRAALGNPWLYSDLLAGQESHPRPLDQLLAELACFYSDVAAEMGLERAIKYMRKFFGWYLAPFKPSGELRNQMFRAESFAEVVGAVKAEYGV